MASQTQSQNKALAKPKSKKTKGFPRSPIVQLLEQIYITNPEPISIKQLVKHEVCLNKDGKRKKSCSLDNIRQSCARHDWVKKRDAFWERASTKALVKQENQAAKIIARQYEIADFMNRTAFQGINNEISRRLLEHKAAGGTDETFIPLEMHESLPTLHHFLRVERELLQLTEADLDDDDGVIDIDQDDYEDIQELSRSD